MAGQLVTLKWAGSYLNGPATGFLEVRYDGGASNEAGTDFTFFPSPVKVPLQVDTVQVGDETRKIGVASIEVLPSNDPSIAGGGGTYTITENLHAGGGRSYSVVADKDAPGGVIWVNKLAPAQPTPGEPVSVVYYADFTDLVGRVEALEVGGVGGGTGTGGVTLAQVNNAILAHVNDTTPHTEYDDLPSLSLLFENGIV